MNCEKYQDLFSDLIDGLLTANDCENIEAHLSACPDCVDARNDLRAIVEFCHEHRGEYEAVPNERALWLRISNTIEAESPARSRPQIPQDAAWWFRLMNRSWRLSFPQLAGSVVVLMLMVSVATVFGLRRFTFGDSSVKTAGPSLGSN